MTTHGMVKGTIRAATATALSILLLIGGLGPVAVSAVGSAPASPPKSGAASGKAANPVPSTRGQTVPPPIVSHVPEAGNRVALTFDAGWEFVNTTALLDLLSSRGVKATFFLRGGWVAVHPDLVKAIAAGGHVIESHSFTHPDMTKLISSGVTKELADTEDAVLKAVGVKVDLFRPPYGAYNQEMLRVLGERGYRAMIMWDVDSLDWTGLATDKLTDRVLSLVKPGSIVLMHVGGANTVKALPAILNALESRGLKTVTVPELLRFYKGPSSSGSPPAVTVAPPRRGEAGKKSGTPVSADAPLFAHRSGSPGVGANSWAQPETESGPPKPSHPSGLKGALASVGGFVGRMFRGVHDLVTAIFGRLGLLVGSR